MTDDIPQKRCSKCREEFPSTTEFFYRDKSRKDGLTPQCRKCVSELQKAYRSQPEVQEHIKAYRETHNSKPEVLENRKAYYKERNSRPERQEHLKTYNKAYYSRPEVQERSRTRWKSYSNLPEIQEHRRVIQKAYMSQPESRSRRRVNEHRRRARKKGALGTYTVQDMQRIYKAQKGECYWCRKKIEWGKHHEDHIIPLSRGGSNWPDNMCVSCPSCNRKKHNKLPHEWPEGGRLL